MLYLAWYRICLSPQFVRPLVAILYRASILLIVAFIVFVFSDPCPEKTPELMPPTEAEDHDNDDEKEPSLTQPLSVASANLLVYFCIAGTYFCLTENWSFTDGIYFIVTSVTTVGFGDVMPSNEGPWIAALLLVLLGVALIANFVSSLHRGIKVGAIRFLYKVGEASMKATAKKHKQRQAQEAENITEPRMPVVPRRKLPTRAEMDAIGINTGTLDDLITLGRYIDRTIDSLPENVIKSLNLHSLEPEKD